MSEVLYDFVVNNIVATFEMEIEDKIDLNNIKEKFEKTEYNPTRFPGLVMRFDNPKATLLIFSTGKIVCTGMKHPDEVTPVIKLLNQNMDKCGIKIKKVTYEIQNVVGSGDIKGNIDLNLAAVVMDNAMYEPEVFPGLIYRMANPKAVFLLFSTGRIVCTGSKTIDDANASVNKLYHLVREVGVLIEGNVDDEEEDMQFV